MSISHETTTAIGKHLRILGYRYPSVEWDGAMAAARAYAERSCGGEAFPVTLRREDAQRLFDLATDSPLVCSGSFETDDVVVLRRLAEAIGVDPNVATPDEFAAQYPHLFKRRAVHAVMGYTETGEQAQARIAEERADPSCRVGPHGRWCGKLADDPIHQTTQMGA